MAEVASMGNSFYIKNSIDKITILFQLAIYLLLLFFFLNPNLKLWIFL